MPAASAPRPAKKNSELAATAVLRNGLEDALAVKSQVIPRGSMAPTVKAAPEESAACMGRARL